MKSLALIAGIAVASPVMSLTEFNGATLEAHWDTPVDKVDNGDVVVSRALLSMNDPHGHVDEREASSIQVRAHVDNGIMLDLPDVCGPDSFVEGSDAYCFISTVDDDGIALEVPFSVEAQGPHGSTVQVHVELGDDLEASTEPLPIESQDLFDVVMSPSGILVTEPRYEPGAEMTVVVPVMFSIPRGGSAEVDSVDATFEIETSSGVDVADAVTHIEIVPLHDEHGLIGMVESSALGELPEFQVDMSDGRVHLSGEVDDVPHLRTDMLGHPLDRIPLASFGLELTYELYRNEQDPKVSSWNMSLADGVAHRGDTVIEDREESNNHTDVSLSVPGSGNASFQALTRLVPQGGSVDDMRPEDRDLFNPDIGTGATVPAAPSWAGNGPVLPGDQLFGSVSSTRIQGKDPGSFPEEETHSFCLIFDHGRSTHFNGRARVENLSTYTLEYLTEDMPDLLLGGDCGAGEWSTAVPEPEEVRAIRATFQPRQQESIAYERPILRAGYVVDDAMKEDEYAWMSGNVSFETNEWPDLSGYMPITELDHDYGHTHGFRDAVKIAHHRPHVSLAVNEDVLGAGDVALWTVDSLVSASPFTDRGMHEGEFRLLLPPGVEFEAGIDGFHPEVIETDDGQLLSWEYELGIAEAQSFSFTSRHVGQAGLFEAVVDLSVGTESHHQVSAEDGYVVHDSTAFSLLKSVTSPEVAIGGANQWTLTLANDGSDVLESADTIDVLPYTGDGRGTVLSGTVEITDIAAPDDVTVYVSVDDPTTINPDPQHRSNGRVGHPSEKWEPWNGQGNVTAVRLIQPTLLPHNSVEYAVSYINVEGESGDTLVNSAQTRTSRESTMVNSMSSTLIAPPAQLQVDKRLAGSDTVMTPGETAEFVITVKNSGDTIAEDVDVRDIPVTGIENAEFVSVDQGTFSGSTWNIGSLEPGETREGIISAVLTGESIENMVIADICEGQCEIEPPTQCVPNYNVDSDTDSCDVVIVDEAAVLKVSKEFVEVSDTEVVFEIVVLNDVEPRDGYVTTASGVIVSDIPIDGIQPESVRFLDGTQTRGIIEDGQWVVGSMPAGELHSVMVKAQLLHGSDTISNAAIISSDKNPREFTDTNSVQPNETVEEDTDQADIVSRSVTGALAIDKYVDTIDGADIMYRIDIGNMSLVDIADVTIDELPDTGLEDVELFNPSIGLIDEMSWVIETLSAGERAHVYVRGTATGETAVNRVRISSPDLPHDGGYEQNDGLENDTDQGDTVMTQIGQVDLRLHKTVDVDTGQFVIEVCNLGDIVARDVVVVDEGGPGVESFTSDHMRYSDGQFELGVMSPGECETLLVDAQLHGHGHNVAYVTSPDDPIAPEANQDNDSIESDTDGWDKADFAVPGLLAKTGPQVVPAVILGIVMIGSGLLLARRLS